MYIPVKQFLNKLGMQFNQMALVCLDPLTPAAG